MEKKDNYIRNILKQMQKMKYISPDDIPNIDLYMDQVTTFMDENLKESRRFEEDKLITKTMINNYTKNNLLPPPNKKKYTKEHILLLIFIYYFKNILSISDIRSIFQPLNEKYYGKSDEAKISLEEIYEEVFGYESEQVDDITVDIIRKYRKARKAFAKDDSPENRDFLTTFSLICTLSFDVYVKKMLVERLIDDQLASFEEEEQSSERGTKAASAKAKKTPRDAEKAKRPKQEKRTKAPVRGNQAAGEAGARRSPATEKSGKGNRSANARSKS